MIFLCSPWKPLIKFHWRNTMGKVFPSFLFLCSGGQNFLLHVLSKQYEIGDLYIYRNKPTKFSQIKIYPLQILRVFLGQSGEKGWSEDETQKNGWSLWFAQPSLHNIPLFQQDLHRKHIWKCPGALTSYWQLMDGSNPISAIQNDKVQKWRGWVTVAKVMNWQRNLHSRRLILIFLHEEDNEWVDNSGNSLSAMNISLKNNFTVLLYLC